MCLDVASLSQQHPWAAALLLALGALTFVKFAAKTVAVLLQTFVLPGTPLTKFGAKKGAWAIVTGASDGIGREFALQLARAGFGVVLVARNPQKLATVAAEITGPTKVVALDFADRNASFKELEELAKELDVGVLVNNVGKSHVMPVDYVDTAQQEIDDILAVNVNGTLRVTSAVLPGMIQRRRGLVLTLGSFSGAVQSPMLATYSGSKAFLSTWSDALAAELAPRGITVQCLNTYFVVSAMSKIRRANALVPTPKAYVRACLARVGLQGGAVATGRPASATLFPTHALLDYAMNVVGWKSAIIKYTHNMHKDIRRRALRKAEREAKGQ